jgi:hypothetical protein
LPRQGQLHQDRKNRHALRGNTPEPSVLTESEPNALSFVLTRFLHANRYPLRSKTL